MYKIIHYLLHPTHIFKEMKLNESICTVPFEDIYLSSQLSKLSYQDEMLQEKEKEGEGKLKDILEGKSIFFESDAHAQVYGWIYDRVFYLAFRGSDGIEDIMIDIDVRMIELENNKGKNIFVHSGFQRQFDSIAPMVLHTLINRSKEFDRINCCGHSLGGSLATLAALHFNNLPGKQITLHTFGSPRIGNKNFTKMFYEASPAIDHWRVFNSRDFITMVPASGKYTHVNNKCLKMTDKHFQVKKTHSNWTEYLLRNLICFKPIGSHDISLYITRVKKFI
jgi:hypothetical protein